MGTNSAHPKVRTLAIDLGGVLFTEGKKAAAERLKLKFGYDEKVVLGALRSPLSLDLRRGLVSDDEFWSSVKSALPEGYDAEAIRREWYDGYELNRNVFELLTRLSARCRLIAFSGNVKSRVEFLEKKYGFRKLFDLELYSYDYHFTKPDPGFLDVLLEKCGCESNSLVYVDDDEAALELAAKKGVRTILFDGDAGKLEDELKKAGIE